MREILFMALNAVIVDGRWVPGIGDPTIVGWLTVVAYFAAALLCVRAARRSRHATGTCPVFWLTIAAMMFALAINKQLDFQTLFTQTARDVLKSRELYEYRRKYQEGFIVCVAATCAIILAAVLYSMRKNIASRWPVLLGMAFLLGFVTIRAASFHHVDAFLASTLGGLRWNWILELSGILLIAWGAAKVRPHKVQFPALRPGP